MGSDGVKFAHKFLALDSRFRDIKADCLFRYFAVQGTLNQLIHCTSKVDIALASTVFPCISI